MKGFRAVIAALAAVSALALSAQVARADCDVGNCWGAVAFGPNGMWAYSINEPSREAASASVNQQCAGRCSRVLTFQNSCGAYASDGGDTWGWGNAGTREAAEERALQECGSGCQVRVWGCTQR